MRIKSQEFESALPTGLRETDEIVVLIPLERWSKDNGFFLKDVEMQPGEDICIHGREPVKFPGPGGALVIMLVLSW